MEYIMFTKHLEGLDVPGLAAALQSVGVQGADLCVRPGYPVHPDNVATALPEAGRFFAGEGLSIPLVTTPGDFIRPDVEYAEALYGACGEAGVRHIKLGYWHWKPGMDYWSEVDTIRGYLEGFQALSVKHGVQTVVHNHSGHSLGLNSNAVMNLVRGLDPQHIGVFADPGHLSICGEPIDMALEIVREYLAILAFKDLMRRPGDKGPRVVRLGHGFGNWTTLLQTLKAMDYSGAVSFHSEYSGEPVDTVIDLARCDVRFINALREEI